MYPRPSESRVRQSRRWWGGEDLNPRRRTPADLQSAPFGHLGTSPNPLARAERPPEKLGCRSTTGAAGGNRTPDPLLPRPLPFPLATPAQAPFQFRRGSPFG